MQAAPATHAELAETLSALSLGLSASELHGSLTGFLCAGGLSASGSWLQDLALDEVEDALGDSPRRELFVRLFDECAELLDDPDYAFEPLLPDDEAPIAERAGALVEWCRGFLGGLGLSGSLAHEGLAGDAGEVLTDLGRIAATSFDTGEADDDEDAYSEVVEYVRVGVLLLHGELARAPRDATRH